MKKITSVFIILTLVQKFCVAAPVAEDTPELASPADYDCGIDQKNPATECQKVTNTDQEAAQKAKAENLASGCGIEQKNAAKECQNATSIDQEASQKAKAEDFASRCGFQQNNSTEESQNATNIDQEAAQKAKAAQDGQEKAKQAKGQLCEKGDQAARIAQAALPAKDALVKHLQQDIEEAECREKQEANSKLALESIARSVSNAHQQACSEIKVLQTALKLAQVIEEDAVKAQQFADQQVSDKEKLLDAAKARRDDLKLQLKKAKQDLKETGAALRKAQEAVTGAKQNASRNKRVGTVEDDEDEEEGEEEEDGSSVTD